MKKIMFMFFVMIASFGLMSSLVYEDGHDPPGDKTEIVFIEVGEIADVFMFHNIDRCGEAPYTGPGDLFTYCAEHTRSQEGITLINKRVKVPDWDKQLNRQSHPYIRQRILPRIRHV